MPKLYFLLVVTGLFASLFVQGQDEHLTLFHRAPLHYNPALTGISQYETRAGLNYRSQWASIDKAFSTMSAYADRSMEFGFDRVAAGIILMNDRSGLRRLNASKVKIAGAYHKRLGKHYLSAGIQPGLIYQSINDPTLPDNYDPATGDFVQTNLDGQWVNPLLFDLGAGMTYQYKADDWQVGLGQSALHLTQPNLTFLDDPDARLSMRHVTYSWARWSVSPHSSVHPRLLYMTQNQATEGMFSVSYDHEIYGELYDAATVSGGVALRNNFKGYDGRNLSKSLDVISILFGVGWENYRLDMSYDLNTTDLHEATQYRGAFELALTYMTGFVPSIQKIAIPCIRY